ncbi:MAG TPA: DUF1570 domain-containing protein [Lacipirellula sp.]
MGLSFHIRRCLACLMALAGAWLLPATSWSLEHVTVVAKSGDRPKKLSGEVVVQARDGILLKTADGGLHTLLDQQIVSRETDSKPLVMLNREQLTEQVLEQLPPGFRVHASKNYIVCYNTTRTYAQWTSSLLERLQRAFIAYWEKQGCDVKAPEQPLVVLVFADQASYARYSRDELGAALGNVIGYYSPNTNTTVMYDLTGMQAVRRAGGGRGSLHDITELLSRPQAEPLVATIVHEATHQISFNCGLQARMVSNPLWLSEGLAAYFETPDLTSSRSWSGIGNVNYARFDRFVANYEAGRVAPLVRMLGDDDLFRQPETAVDSYAQAWAWNYFLIKWKPKEYAAYLKMLSEKPLLVDDDPKTRVAEFRKFFGGDLKALEDEFYRRMSRVN